MSFDIFLSHIKNQKLTPFQRSAFEDIFGPHLDVREAQFVRARFPDGSGADIFIEDTCEITNMMFNHCGGDQFSDAFFELLQRTDSVVFWPGGGCVVADASVIPHLPADMIKSLGPPTVVSSGAEIFGCIRRS